MLSTSRIDPGPPVVEIIFKSCSLGVLAVIVLFHVMGFMGALVAWCFGALGFDAFVLIMVLAMVAALLGSVAVVVTSVTQDVMSRVRGRVRIQRFARRVVRSAHHNSNHKKVIMNSILVIHPYRFEGTWVFDDPKAGLVQEPFVSGADVILDRLTADIPDAANGFTLLFSSSPFPGFQAEFDWRREELGGNWYYSAALDLEGWLCPALFRYFEAAPPKIYAQCKAKVQ